MTNKAMINDMALRLSNGALPQGKRSSGMNEMCSRCGAQFNSSMLSLREMGLAAICEVLLLSIVLPAGWMAKQWIDRQEDRFLDHMYWHEPLDIWSL